MSLNNLFSILCFFLIVSFGYVSAAPQCGDSLFFRPNSTYDINRRLVLSTLASNVSSRDGFYNVSVGEGPGKIYALGLCIPGTDPKVCSDCIQPASNGLLQNCPNQTDSWDWRADKTLCFVRYSNSSIFNQFDLKPTQAETNTGRFTGNVTAYTRVWDAFMDFMITRVGQSRYLADISPDIGDGSLNGRVYALMQCIPGISSEECETCLRENVRVYQSCCNGYIGGSVRKPVCFFRWDGYAYLGAFDDTPSLPPQESQPTPIPPSPPPPPPSPPPPLSTGAIVAIVVSAVIFVVLLFLGFVIWKKKQSYKTLDRQTDDDMTSPQSLQFDFATIEAATDRFSRNNKLGQGGFGEVYKGTLLNGTEVAVKRLSQNSGQGTQEFKNEVVIVAKLQHKNLVRLLGFCVERNEQILVYEFVPNKSLDYFLFDPTKKSQLDWKQRYTIIGGITRGILYLHQDSRLTIIHRDIKASNILLDVDMNPKIADFGMARNFRVDQMEDQTGRVVGTFGYMPPEYVTHGQYSTKSDVYSFGVLILEIVCGKKNSSFYQVDDSGGNLVTHVWRLWNNESPLDLIDPAVGKSYEKDEVIRCIHIGLLCVQETPADRPAMSTIFQMLTNSYIILPVPRPPGFFFRNRLNLDPLTYGSELGQSSSKSVPCSSDSASITVLTPR